VPPKVPAADFWAITGYDVQTRALIEAPQHVSEINPDVRNLKANTDGSIDLFFGPAPQPGMEENWIQTVPGQGLRGTLWLLRQSSKMFCSMPRGLHLWRLNPEQFAYFRWYGPTEAFYEKSWSLPDIELMR
jgi:hypothetical protein